jgi:hypothetical protein
VSTLRRLWPALVVVAAACLPDAPAGPTDDTDPSTDAASLPGVIVSFPDVAAGDSAGLAAVADSVFGSTDSTLVVRHYPQNGMVWVRGLTDDEQLRIAGDPRVGITDTLATATIAQSTASWALDRLDQRALPLNGQYSNTLGTGAGVRIYIFDTGLKLDHAQFASRAQFGADFVEPALSSPGDCHGHGTLSASAAAGGTLGSAPGATLIDVRVLGCTGGGSGADFLEGVNWVLQQKQANPSVPMIANMSLGFGSGWAPADVAVANLVAAGVHVVAAAGNSNVDACGVSPAREPRAITVGATANTDARASFSNFGNCVDVYAPGAQVTGAALGSTTATQTWSGTSAAAPYVSGVVASYIATRASMSPAQVESNLIGGAATGVLTGATPNRLAWANFAASPPPAPAPLATMGVLCKVRRCVASVTNSRGQPVLTGRTIQTTGTLRDAITATPTGGAWRFAQPGTYTVTAIGTHAGTSQTSRTERTIVVRDQPPTVSSPRARCTGGVCTFSASGRDDEGIASVSWAFSNNTTATGFTPTATFSSGGTYTATVTVRDSIQQARSATVSFTVANQAPIAALVVRCSGRTCTLDAGGSRDDSGIASYTFNSGASGAADITTSAPTTSVTYSFAGTYQASVRVTDRTGLTATRTASVTVQ